jgi:probable rRNA maturation factor
VSLEVTVVEDGARTSNARGLGSWLARSAPKSARGQVTIAIFGDARMRALNRTFRRIDRVTDVLSFPAGGRSAFLGDIVIARGRAARQARAFGHRVGIEMRILALHGLLHLLGYDHEVDKGQMARVEQRLRRRARLPDGLIARSA